MENKNCTTLVVTSGKGGVGKTTTTANLGVGLALRGNRVLVIDADIGLRNLDVVMGLENRVVYDLVQAIEGVCRVQQAMIRDKVVNNLYLIPAAQTRDKNAVNAQQMCDLCSELKSEFDFIIIDSPAGIEQGFKNAIAPADRAILVTTPEVSAVRDADRIIGLVEAEGIPTPELILNRVRIEMMKQKDMMSTEDILSLLSVPLIGLVPEDDGIIISTNRGIPAAHDIKNKSGQAYRRIAARVDGEEVPFPDMSSENGLFNKIRNRVGLILGVQGNA